MLCSLDFWFPSKMCFLTGGFYLAALDDSSSLCLLANTSYFEQFQQLIQLRPTIISLIFLIWQFSSFDFVQQLKVCAYIQPKVIQFSLNIRPKLFISLNSMIPQKEPNQKKIFSRKYPASQAQQGTTRQINTRKNIDTAFAHYDLQKCYLHRQAHNFGQPIQNSKLCQCCNEKYQKTPPLSACFDRSEISYYGEGLTLYFQFMKMATIMAFVVMMTYGLPNIVNNFKGNTCSSQPILQCSDSIFVKGSAINKISNVQMVRIQSFLSILAILAMFIVVQVFRKRFHDIESQIDKITGPEKYAVFMTVNMDEHVNGLQDRKIKRQLVEWWKKQLQLNPQCANKLLIHLEPQQVQNLERRIHQIYISYDIHLAKQINQKLQELNELVQLQNQAHILSKFKVQLKQIREQVQKIDVRVNNKFLAVFEYQNLARYFYQRNHASKILTCLGIEKQNYFKYDKFEVQVYKAPLPTQILWQNHHIRGSYKKLYRIGIYAFSFLLLLVGEGLVFLVLYFWFKNGDSTSDLSTYISSLVSAFITGINFLLYEIFLFISKFEYRSVMMEDQISRSVKIIISVCLNSGLLLLGAYFILDLQSLWHQNGFVDTISYTFVYAIFTPHFLKYINVYNCIKLYRYFKVKGGNSNYTQKMANLYFEKPEGYQSYHYYSWEVTLLWMACFFGPILPVAFFCVFVTFFIQYWLEKLNYLYYYKERKPWGGLLNRSMTQIVQVSQFLLALGQVCLQLIIRTLRGQSLDMQSVSVSLTLLVITSLHIFILPKDIIVRIVTCWYCRQRAKQKYDLSFEQAKQKFITNYEKQANRYFNQKSINNVEKIRKQMHDKIDQIEILISRIQTECKQVESSFQKTQENLVESKILDKNKFDCLESVLHEGEIGHPINSYQQPKMIFLHNRTLKTIKEESSYISNSVRYSNI